MSSPASAHDIAAVAALTLHDPADTAIALVQTRHRFDLLAQWNIPPGARVLELGCGQGDCTAALAHAVGPAGHVTAVDPGPIATYGSPYTLAQAQAHLSAGPLGSRITWVEADPLAFLAALPPGAAPFDVAVLAHCIWYFPRPATLAATLAALAPRAARVAVAEWGASASAPGAGMPHVLAAFAQAALHPHLPASASNVRTVVAPSAIKAAAARAGLALAAEHLLVPTPGLQDGQWEVMAVKAPDFAAQIEAHVQSEQARVVLYALKDAALDSANALKARGEKVQCMDVWTGVFVPEST